MKRKLLALFLVIGIWLSVTPFASAQAVETVSGLVPCKDSPAFVKRAEVARNTTADPESGKKRFERYSSQLCGEADGLPRLIVDGRLSHAGEFLIPGILFLYITGFIGWAGRAYLIAVREGKNPEEKEIIIDVPLAIKSIVAGLLWPPAALGELLSGKLTAADDEITVSPR
jgi:photosystem I subunit 3